MEPSQPHCVACIPPHKDSPDLVHGPIPAYILPHKDSMDLVYRSMDPSPVVTTTSLLLLLLCFPIVPLLSFFVDIHYQ